MKAHHDLLRILPYAGALPFVGCALLMVVGIADVPLLGKVDIVLSSYGLAIVSFMAGVHWGQYLSGVRTQVNLLVSSNVATLAAWLGFLVLPVFHFCILLLILFIALNAIDRHLRDDGAIAVIYGETRRNVTILVCLSLLAAAFA